MLNSPLAIEVKRAYLLIFISNISVVINYLGIELNKTPVLLQKTFFISPSEQRPTGHIMGLFTSFQALNGINVDVIVCHVTLKKK